MSIGVGICLFCSYVVYRSSQEYSIEYKVLDKYADIKFKKYFDLERISDKYTVTKKVDVNYFYKYNKGDVVSFMENDYDIENQYPFMIGIVILSIGLTCISAFILIFLYGFFYGLHKLYDFLSKYD